MEHTPEIQARQESLGAARERFDQDPHALATAFETLADSLVDQGMQERTGIIEANYQERSRVCDQAQDEEQAKIIATADRSNGRLADVGFFDDLLDAVPPNGELTDFWTGYWNAIEVRQAIHKGRREAQQKGSNNAIEMKEAILRQAIQAQSKEGKELVRTAADTTSLENLDKIITSQTLSLIRVCDDSTRSLIRTCTDELEALKALLEQSDEGLTTDLTQLEATLEELIAQLHPAKIEVEEVANDSSYANVHSIAAARARQTRRRAF